MSRRLVTDFTDLVGVVHTLFPPPQYGHPIFINPGVLSCNFGTLHQYNFRVADLSSEGHVAYISSARMGRDIWGDKKGLHTTIHKQLSNLLTQKKSCWRVFLHWVDGEVSMCLCTVDYSCGCVHSTRVDCSSKDKLHDEV